ncbi:MAG: site-specific DNA-methyltransferase [Polaromonas sp.]|uniref:site-specific DNA-methyltransferase n=1 Tax=Polaromonas sp. TaxID=1869339 RepID=UPI002732CF01|nr:site-specific DNA-methyltransferase [Polaromonas sp.]MDP2818137.1 site-specific DNA-methyltransferase [Polaromonas sp.]
MSKQKLELTWIGKDQRPRLEPRILLEDPKRSYHAKQRVTDNDFFGNRLIKGDNLLALKALEAEFAGKVKCVFIDPPYNTGSAFTHYDDGLEHSIWLGLMRDRLEIIRRLLSDDGSLWITIDDNEAHYLKVVCDEVFGRANFLTTVIWEKKYAPKADSKFLSSSHDFVLVCAKNMDRLQLNRLQKTEKQTSRYTNRDNDSRGPWKAGDTLRNEVRDYAVFPVKLPSGREVFPSAGTSWRYTKEKFADLIADNRIWFGVDGDGRPAIKRFISEVTETIPATTVWRYDDVGHNDEAKKESKALFGDGVFGTPKPERLMAKILELATNPGDLVLDSFAGSGTTGAVAHKMGRRWIMVELGEHCHTHIVPRLQKVIDGQDPGGVTQATGWQGGGGFRYYELAPTLLATDRWGNLVINPQYDAAMLAAAMCKLEGFSYAPSEVLWWQQGHSSERDFIYVTTQTLSSQQLASLNDEVGADPNNPRSLLVCCGAYRGVTAAQAAERWPNLTIKKIPKMVKDRCEWGHDDYSLNVANLPMAQKKVEAPAQNDLFDGDAA